MTMAMLNTLGLTKVEMHRVWKLNSKSTGALALVLILCMMQNITLVNSAHAGYLSDSKDTRIELDVRQQKVSQVRVTGKVTLSPVCPVVRFPPDPACAPRPYKTTLQIKRSVGGAIYKTITTNALGTFAIALVPGRFILQVKRGTNAPIYPRCAPLDFVVTAKKPLHLEMSCDTGIR
jgi:hypothetical protein